VFEFKRCNDIKKGASRLDAPWTNNLWQLRKLELHCRQKARSVQCPNQAGSVVVEPPHVFYPQLHHRTGCPSMGQLVGDLWKVCGVSEMISHRGLKTISYAEFSWRNTSIV